MRRSILLLLTGLVLAAEPPVVVSRATVYRHGSDDPYDGANKTGFNHGANVTVLPDGRLFAVWFSAAYEASVNQLLLASYSSDEGKSWTKAEVFNDFPRTSDFDPALLRDGERVWAFFSAGRWIRWPFVSDQANLVGEQSFQIYYRLKEGKGDWSAPQKAQVDRAYNCRNNGIKLTSGELLLPIYRLADREASVLKSRDGGKTWQRFGAIRTPEGQDEPTIVELKSGAVLMYLRTGGGVLWKTVSRDKGETWTATEKVDLVAARSSHSLFRLRDGRIVLTHNAHGQYRTPLTLRISEDDGSTWGAPVTLAEVTPGPAAGKGARRQVSYPTVTQLAGGDLVVLWSDIGIGDEAQWGDIQSARVRVR